MADLYGAIKHMIADALDYYEMCDMELGLVMSVKPLEVKLSDRIILKATQLLLTQTVVQKTINCAHTHKSDDPVGLPAPIVVREGLKTGDEVLLLKVAKGQKYIIISKVVRP